MNDIKIFERPEFGAMRVFERNGEPWFVAKDVCICLGIGNTADAVSSLDDDEKGVDIVDTLGGAQEMSTISEAGLHKGGNAYNMPTQRSIDAGWMEVKEGSRIGSNGECHITRTPKITGKGQIYFINLFHKEKNNA